MEATDRSARRKTDGAFSSFPRTRNKQHAAAVVQNQGWPTEVSCRIWRDGIKIPCNKVHCNFLEPTQRPAEPFQMALNEDVGAAASALRQQQLRETENCPEHTVILIVPATATATATATAHTDRLKLGMGYRKFQHRFSWFFSSHPTQMRDSIPIMQWLLPSTLSHI